jgi:hypothetical protein
MSKSKTAYMPESGICALEQMTEGDVVAYVAQKGPKLPETIIALVRSYRIAATVANGAWKFMKEAEKNAVAPDTIMELQQALHLYSPENFKPMGFNVELACRSLEEAYNELALLGVKDEILECVFRRIVVLRQPSGDGV